MLFIRLVFLQLPRCPGVSGWEERRVLQLGVCLWGGVSSEKLCLSLPAWGFTCHFRTQNEADYPGFVPDLFSVRYNVSYQPGVFSATRETEPGGLQVHGQSQQLRKMFQNRK